MSAPLNQSTSTSISFHNPFETPLHLEVQLDNLVVSNSFHDVGGEQAKIESDQYSTGVAGFSLLLNTSTLELEPSRSFCSVHPIEMLTSRRRTVDIPLLFSPTSLSKYTCSLILQSISTAHHQDLRWEYSIKCSLLSRCSASDMAAGGQWKRLARDLVAEKIPIQLAGVDKQTMSDSAGVYGTRVSVGMTPLAAGWWWFRSRADLPSGERETSFSLPCHGVDSRPSRFSPAGHEIRSPPSCSSKHTGCDEGKERGMSCNAASGPHLPSLWRPLEVPYGARGRASGGASWRLEEADK
eukprot:470173-Hanusia_phi.AAC.1